MRKVIVIEEGSSKRLVDNKFLEWLLSIVCYAIVLVMVSLLFDSFYISNEYFGLYALLASVILFVLNKTIKPVLVLITLPLTAFTLGIFYPFINLFLLKIVSFLLGDKFVIQGVVVPLVIVVLISFFNLLLEGMVIKPIVKGR